MDATVEISGEELCLLPERAVFWSRSRTLIVADTHWGKDATFRAAGIPIPPQAQRDDLARLSSAIERTEAQRLVVLGDLLHAVHGRARETTEMLAAWRSEHRGLRIQMVLGNHDRHAGRPPAKWEIDVVGHEFVETPFVFRHDPAESDEGYALCGHLHPVAALQGPGGEQMALPCFWFGSKVGVLPAFGQFTGGARIRPHEGDRVCVVADGSVVQVGP